MNGTYGTIGMGRMGRMGRMKWDHGNGNGTMNGIMI